MTVARWQSKAASLSAAWRQRFGTYPSMPETCLALAVAQHETQCGDAWPTEHNWGAVTLRSLNSLEQAALKTHGVIPTVGPGHVAAAAAAEAAIIAEHLQSPLGPPVTGRIHCDSYPGRGAYFVWFAAFPDDTAGAAYFLKALCRTSEERAALTTGDPNALAAAMYNAGYYAGFHTHSTPEGNAANIADYAKSLAALVPGIRAALSGAPSSTMPTLRYGDKGDSVKQLQTKLGLKADGVFGPLTEGAVIVWQRQHGLKIDGIVGPMTWASFSP